MLYDRDLRSTENRQLVADCNADTGTNAAKPDNRVSIQITGLLVFLFMRKPSTR
jgi:hypothetical protein